MKIIDRYDFEKYQAEKSRDQERQATGGGEVFFMRKKNDLSSKDAEVVLG